MAAGHDDDVAAFVQCDAVLIYLVYGAGDVARPGDMFVVGEFRTLVPDGDAEAGESAELRDGAPDVAAAEDDEFVAAADRLHVNVRAAAAGHAVALRQTFMPGARRFAAVHQLQRLLYRLIFDEAAADRSRDAAVRAHPHRGSAAARRRAALARHGAEHAELPRLYLFVDLIQKFDIHISSPLVF